MAQRTDALAGLRILIVEDEVLIGMMLESMLEDLGCQVIGLASGLNEAIAAVKHHSLDGVLLDMNMAGEDTHVVAEELAARAVPFLLVTGYDGMDTDPPAIRNAPRLRKPFSQDELAQWMVEVFGPSTKKG